MKTGKLILLAGLFGAGKTTLMNAAVAAIDNLDYVVTYTTRPQRDGEVSGKGEYIFVNDEAYLKAKNSSNNWDEYIVYDFYYGNDLQSINKEFEKGKNLILCTSLRKSTINQMKSLYDAESILILIDVDLTVANDRVIKDGRGERAKKDLQSIDKINEVKEFADYIYKPVTDIEQNKKDFIQLVEKLII